MNTEELAKILDDHKKSLNGVGGRRADLQCAYLRHADLQGADLRGADLDFSAWPLWCGTKGVKVCDKIARQLAAHFCAIECDSEEYRAARAAILEYAKGSHRAAELRIKEDGDE